MKKYISVDKGRIAKNAANGTNEPVLVVEREGVDPVWAYEVHIEGPSKLVYSPNSGRLNSAWIETDAHIRVRWEKWDID